MVLVKAPSLYPYWYDEYEEQIQTYAKENDLDFYNFINVADEIGIDYQKDTYDGGLHLNLNGAEKLSKYFGTILKQKYNLTDYRKNKDVNSLYQKKLEQYYKAINN